jgi:hypothetical protein
MTQDEIIPLPPYLNASYEGDDLYSGNQVRELMQLVAAKKQEDIIQIIKETPFSNWFQADVIEAIRARGEQA